MGAVIGDILPVALGVAISPVPIIAVILILLSSRATGASLAFLVGWVVGVGVVVTVVTLLVGPADSGSDSSEPSVVSAVLKLVLGLAAVFLGVRQWRHRPAKGEEGTLPAWISAVDQLTPVRALGMAVLLVAVNPKNLTLCLAGGVSIGGADLDVGDTVIAVATFVVIASSSVAVLVVGHLLAKERMAKPLDELRDWLTANNATVMSVLLVVIGAVIFGKGLGAL